MPDPITKTSPTPPEKPADAPPPSDPPSDGVDPAAKPARPDGFGESLSAYWNDDKGVDFGKLSDDVKNLSAFKAEQDSRLAQVPENLDEYEVALPEGFKVPEGMKFEALADDPLVGPAREFAKKQGLTKDGFKELVGLQAQAKIAEDAALKARVGEEKKKLGTKADARIDAVVKWAEAAIGKEKAAALNSMMFTAASVEAFEAVMQVAKASGARPNAGGREVDAPNGKISEEDWAKLSPTERINYARSHAATPGS